MVRGTFIEDEELINIKLALSTIYQNLGILNKQENIEGKDRAIINTSVKEIRRIEEVLKISI